MNSSLVTLFTDLHYVQLLRQHLPRAFEVAGAESLRVQHRQGGLTHETVGQEVGVVRERILVAYLRYALGDVNISLPRANSSMRDVLVYGQPLEIKTASKNGLVTAKWTADTESANRDISSFEFTADLLLVRIWWGVEIDSLFYIPMEVLREIADRHEPSDYLSSARGTNNRGIKIRARFMTLAQEHLDTVRVPIHWRSSNINLDPMARWMAYWANPSDRDPLYC